MQFLMIVFNQVSILKAIHNRTKYSQHNVTLRKAQELEKNFLI